MQYSLVILIAFAILPTTVWSKDAGQADPADPGSAVPPFKYESAFHRYIPHQDAVEVFDWRDTSFDKQAPRQSKMGDTRMQPAPAQSPPPKNGAESSGHGMHHMRKM